MALAVDLSGRVALVTGGTRGSARHHARPRRRGRDRGDLLALAGQAVEAPHRVCDVRDADAVRELVGSLDRLDVLVNNAGGAA